MKVHVHSTQIDKKRARLAVEGDITIYTVGEIKDVFDDRLARYETLEVELGGVTDMDTAGFQLCLYLVREAGAAGKKVLMRGASRAVNAVFKLYNVQFS